MSYPEREVPRDGALDRLAARVQYFAARLPGARLRLGEIVPAVHAAEATLGRPDAEDIAAAALALRPRLRREGFSRVLAAESFALTRAAAFATLGLRHFDVQLVGGWALLNGAIAEMETGEGKTLTATLAAAAAGLSGRAVHVITVNDYLASRDAEAMGPVYRALGLSVGCVVHGVDEERRRAQYRNDIVYCSNKELAFDYLRDRLVLGGQPRPVADGLAALAGGSSRARLLLPGLQFAIVDEADSVLIDEGRTPLILSAQADAGAQAGAYRQALALAEALAEDDYRIAEGRADLTAQGEKKLAALAAGLGGIWSGPRRRRRLVQQALAALHLFQRDKHYLVHEGKVQIIDEYTGRLMPDRSWEQGLHQLIELKERCAVTGERETLARISYQRFFRRYRHLCGMTGTASEVAAELWAVYRLRVARIPTHRPVRRRHLPERAFGSAAEKWQAIVAAVRRRHDAGQPVLIGTRSVAASEHLARLLDEAALPYRLLNARQDHDEAQIIAEAGERGRITVATNMAGRGTDIKLGAGVAELGGLHVICTERHDSRRIDRQLFGRCGRQGDPGSCETIVCAQDELVAGALPALAAWLSGRGRLPGWLGRPLFGAAQRLAERHNSSARRELLHLDELLGDQLAFAGRGE